MSKNQVTALIALFLIAGCTSIDKGDGYGVEVWEHFSDISSEKVNRLANEHCKMYGKQAQLEVREPRAFMVSEYDKYRFRCIEKPNTTPSIFQLPVPPKFDSRAPVQKQSMSIEDASQKCLDIGFKSGTETFGSCVLKLTR
jgi:hypothetical protein